MSYRQQALAWIAILVTSIALLVLLRDMLLPFVAGMAIAYFLDPAADWMERRGFRRWVATLLIIGLFFVVAILIVLLLVPLVSDQFAKFMDHLPGYIVWFNERVLPSLQGVAASFGIDLETLDPKTALAGNGEQVMKVIGGVLTGLLGGGQAVFNVLSLLVITPVVGFYLLRDWDHMIARIDSTCRWTMPRRSANRRARSTRCWPASCAARCWSACSSPPSMASG